MSGENDLVTQLGDSTNDTLDGVTGDFVAVLGGGGDDYINVIDADDALVVGGTGNDTIIAADIDGDTFETTFVLYGNEGDDVIRSGNASFEWLSGGEGNDTIEGGDGYGHIFGGAGDDFLVGGAGLDLFQFGLGDGDDTIGDFNVSEDFIGLSGFDNLLVTWEAVSAKMTETTDDKGDVATIVDLTAWGGGTIRLEGVAMESLSEVNFLIYDAFDPDDSPFSVNTVLPDGGQIKAGFSGDDVFSGSQGGDVLFGAEGDDSLDGAGGDDSLFGGEGDDDLDGGAGGDALFGGEGDDTIAGGTGDDFISGDEGDDTLTGGEGADIFLYTPAHGNDTITDFAANEDKIDLSLFGNITSFDDLSIADVDGNAVITLTDADGNQTMLTLEGVARSALDGDDFIFYDSTVEGTAEADRLEGRFGNDTIAGLGGDDRLTGDLGADTFVFASGHGNDTITDFNYDEGEGDLIDLSAFTGITGFSDLTITQDGDDTKIDLTDQTGGGSIVLEDFTSTDLTADHFIFDGG